MAREPTTASGAMMPVEIPPAAAIDYYGMINAPDPIKVAVGDTVVFGFRPQIFVTRAYSVGIGGLHGGSLTVGPVQDAFGRVTNWPN